MPRASDTVEVEGKKFRIVELPVDPPNTIRRILVPADTEENDIPIGSRMLDVRETEGHLARASRPEDIRVGDLVRRFIPNGQEPTDQDSIKGTVEAKLKEGRFRVRFENGVVDRFKNDQLAKVW